MGWTLVASAVLTAGCASEDNPGNSASGTDSDDVTATDTVATETPTGSNTEATSVNTDSASGGSDSSATAEESSESGVVTEVMLGGHTQDFIGSEPIPGSEMQIFGMDALTDVADDLGVFELGPLPPDIDVAIVLEPIMVEDVQYAGAIVPEHTGTMDRTDVVASQINQAIIDEQIMLIQDQMPQMPNLDEAIVIVMVNPFAGGASLADGTVSVTMDPAPEAGTFYAPDAMGAPVLDSTEIGYQVIPAAVFFNLPDTQPGEITVTVEHSVPTAWTCTVDHEVWPTLGAHTTFVLVTCVEA